MGNKLRIDLVEVVAIFTIVIGTGGSPCSPGYHEGFGCQYITLIATILQGSRNLPAGG